MSSRYLTAFVLCVVLSLISLPMHAQQFPQNDHIGPPKAAIIGGIVGAGAAIGVVIYLLVPKQSVIEGCVDSIEGGLRLTSGHNIFALRGSDVDLQPGQRVILKGKKRKKNDGVRDFEVRKLVKNEGVCVDHS